MNIETEISLIICLSILNKASLPGMQSKLIHRHGLPADHSQKFTMKKMILFFRSIFKKSGNRLRVWLTNQSSYLYIQKNTIHNFRESSCIFFLLSHLARANQTPFQRRYSSISMTPISFDWAAIDTLRICWFEACNNSLLKFTFQDWLYPSDYNFQHN